MHALKDSVAFVAVTVDAVQQALHGWSSRVVKKHARADTGRNSSDPVRRHP